MKVWLVNPRTDNTIRTELPGYVAREVGRFPPLGLLYLAAYLRRERGDDVRVLDMPARELSYAEFRRELAEGRPDVVGITAITHNLVEVRTAAECVKEVLPRTPVCLGGPHVDAFPREAAELPPVDFAIRGEGERPFAALLDALERGDEPRDVPGLCRRSDGAPTGTGAAPPVEDLDGLPFPARDLIDPADYYYVLGQRSTFTTLLSSRGCPFRCVFCSTPHGHYRVRSPRRIVDEIEACMAGGAEEFHFVDDTFNVRRERLAEVSREILARGLRIKWSLRGRVDTLDREGLQLARRAGCVRIHLGIETGSDAGLQRLRKEITTAQVEQALAWTRACGITTAAYFLIGCPHERTREDVLRTVAFARRIDPDFALFNILTIYPHTELFEMAVARGLVGPDHWRDFARNPTPDFQMRFWEEFLSRDELVDLLRIAYRRFYLRPGMVWRNLRSLRSWGEVRHKAQAGLALLLGRRP